MAFFLNANHEYVFGHFFFIISLIDKNQDNEVLLAIFSEITFYKTGMSNYQNSIFFHSIE